MPSFDYTALTPGGERIVGVLAGANEQAILGELEARKLTPVRVRPARQSAAASGRRPGIRAMAMAYVQLSDLQRAGVPLLRGLKLLAGQKSSPRLAAVFKEIAEDVEKGVDLAESMAARPRVFPRVQVAMIRAGEKGGFLEQVLGRLGRFMIGQADMRARIIGSLIYPAVLVVMGIGVLAVIFGIFVPKFRPLFARLEQSGQMPGPTKVVLAISEAFAGYAPVTIIVLAVIGFVLWRAARRPDMKRVIARVRLNAPIVGPLVKAIAVARFCRITGTMLGNAVPILSALQISKDAAGDLLLEEAVSDAAEAVRQGEHLSGPLARSGLFTDDVVEMISVGESANNLDEVLVTIAETLEGRVERQLGVTVKLIEPLMLVVLATVVGFVAIALILPMSRLSSAIG